MTTINKLTDVEAEEVSFVNSPANQVSFLIIKSAKGLENELVLPCTEEEKVSYAKHLKESARRLSKLSSIVSSARTEEGAQWPEEVIKEIYSVSAPFQSASSDSSSEVTISLDDELTQSLSSLRKALNLAEHDATAISASAERVIDTVDKCESLKIRPDTRATAYEDFEIALSKSDKWAGVSEEVVSNMKEAMGKLQGSADLRKMLAEAEASKVAAEAEVQELSKKVQELTNTLSQSLDILNIVKGKPSVSASPVNPPSSDKPDGEVRKLTKEGADWNTWNFRNKNG